MKIRCEKCGKKFVYEDYMGICPKCSYYHSMSASSSGGPNSVKTSSRTTGDTTIKAENSQTSANPSTVLKTYQRQKIYATLTQGKQRKVATCFSRLSILQKIFSLIFLVCIFITPCVGYGYIRQRNSMNWKNQLVGQVDYTKATPGESIPCGKDTITILFLQPSTIKASALPEGQRLYELVYHIDDRTENSSSAFLDAEDRTELFLLQADGTYIAPLSWSALTFDMNMDSEELRLNGIDSELRYQDGKVLFLADSNLTQTDLCLYVHGSTTDYNILRKIYRIPLEIQEVAE